MNKSIVLVAVLFGTGLVAQTVYMASVNRATLQMKDRLDRLEARQAESDRKATSEAAKRERFADLIVVPPAPPLETPAAKAAPGGTQPAMTPEEIQTLIDQRVEEKVKSKGEDNGFGGKKRPLADVAREIQVDPVTQNKMAAFANDAKQKVFDLLKLPRADGSNLVDDIMNAMKAGGENQKENTNAQFMRIFKDTIPGTTETYFAAVMRVSEDAMKKFETILTPTQFDNYKHTGVGPLDLETGFDPWAEYLKTK